jgi:hypothetical protein
LKRRDCHSTRGRAVGSKINFSVARYAHSRLAFTGDRLAAALAHTHGRHSWFDAASRHGGSAAQPDSVRRRTKAGPAFLHHLAASSSALDLTAVATGSIRARCGGGVSPGWREDRAMNDILALAARASAPGSIPIDLARLRSASSSILPMVKLPFQSEATRCRNAKLRSTTERPCPS